MCSPAPLYSFDPNADRVFDKLGLVSSLGLKINPHPFGETSNFDYGAYGGFPQAGPPKGQQVVGIFYGELIFGDVICQCLDTLQTLESLPLQCIARVELQFAWFPFLQPTCLEHTKKKTAICFVQVWVICV